MAWCVRQHREITSSLYGLCQASLMLSAGPTPPSRHNLTLTGNIPRQHRTIFIIDLHIPLAKGTNCRPVDEIPRTSYLPSASVNQISFSFTYSSNGKSSGSSSPSSERDAAARLPRKSTRSAVTSRLVRICPSCPSQLRA